jgi:hypothetical protein
MSDVEDYNLEEMSDVEDYNLEEMSDVEDYNLEEMSNNRIGLGNFLPIVKIQPGQKLEDIKKAAKALADKRLVQTTIMKAKEQANIEIKNAIDRLKINPNDPIAKQAVKEANKKLVEIRKAAREIIKKGSNTIKNDLIRANMEVKNALNKLKNNPNDAKAKKAVEDANKKLAESRKSASKIIRKGSDAVKNNLRLAMVEAKKARDYLRNNPNDAKARKAVEDANKKLAESRKKSTEMAKKAKENAAKLLVQNTMIKDLQKAERAAKNAMDFFNKNPKDPRAKKLADEANKKYQQAKQLTNSLINKLVDNKSISKQHKNELSIKINEIDLNKLSDNLVSVMDYDGVVYICQRDSVRPLSIWATKLNEMINKNKFSLLTVIPHYYYLDSKFNYVLIFVFNDDFCVILNKENLSQVLDVKSVLGISFNQNVPDKINCDDLKVILEQMTRGNVISANKSKSLLKRYKC